MYLEMHIKSFLLKRHRLSWLGIKVFCQYFSNLAGYVTLKSHAQAAFDTSEGVVCRDPQLFAGAEAPL